MLNESNNQCQTFLIELLKATSKKHNLYSLLSQNIDKINEDLALKLRQWSLEQFKHRPSTAIPLAKVIYEFSKTIQESEYGNPFINLEIAIAGYEISLQVYTREDFPNYWYDIQQALLDAYQQRQHVLSVTITQLKYEAHQSLVHVNTIFERLPQQLKQAELQLEDLRTELIELKEKAVKFVKTDEIKSIILEFQEIKEKQNSLQEINLQTYNSLNEFNTAIFYDIQNLNLGRNNSHNNFSFKEIQSHLKTTDIFKKSAVQCAYADWSDVRLKLLKDEIQELGVEPIQIFDFGHKKNAADIQLSIDAMELVVIRPFIQVFVIVSGDGGFASLAKKLHEYGKTVIGCGYEGKINRFFQSICDYFIILPSLKENIEDLQINHSNDFAKHTDDDIFLKTKLTLQKLHKENKIGKDGISISQVHIFLKAEIPDFDEKRSKEENGRKLSTFLKKSLEGTRMCISNNNNKLMLKTDLATNTIELAKNN
ncbi:NYN domain-containing protein [Anabaena subtropica]|uniref:NYN domain-containing protein n=1 Tax=Anabaena subtropica FACHB-260 TaxID=2692884 RepID=A0ABR8CI24_9NOST|nr:NYN domain-containing protein [Anabaena subtropica]MBD2342846.1 NYN domain-containing protein [Anabaena subtropica FACHB-260]